MGGMPTYSLSNIFVLSLPDSQKIHPRWLLILFLVLLQLNPLSFFFPFFFLLILKLILCESDFLQHVPRQQCVSFLQPSTSLAVSSFSPFSSLFFPLHISFLLQVNEDRKSLLLLSGWYSWVAQKVLGMNLLLPSRTLGASMQTCLLKFKYKDSLALYVLT